MLTNEEKSVLKFVHAHGMMSESHRRTLVNAMLRLYPPDWNDPVTPERLVKLGGTLDRFEEFPDCAYVFFGPIGDKWYVEFNGRSIVNWNTHGNRIPRLCFPRNMLEAQQLLERCGAIKENV